MALGTSRERWPWPGREGLPPPG